MAEFNQFTLEAMREIAESVRRHSQEITNLKRDRQTTLGGDGRENTLRGLTIGTTSAMVVQNSIVYPGEGTFQVYRRRPNDGTWRATAETHKFLNYTRRLPSGLFLTFEWDKQSRHWALENIPAARFARATLAADLLTTDATATITGIDSVNDAHETLSSDIVTANNWLGSAGTSGDDVLITEDPDVASGSSLHEWLLVAVEKCPVDIVTTVRVYGGELQAKTIKAAVESAADICGGTSSGAGYDDEYTTISDLCDIACACDFDELRFRDFTLSITNADCGDMDAQDVELIYYDGDDWEQQVSWDDTYTADAEGGWKGSYSATGGNCDFDFYLTYDNTDGKWYWWIDCYANKKEATVICDPFSITIDFTGCEGGGGGGSNPGSAGDPGNCTGLAPALTAAVYKGGVLVGNMVNYACGEAPGPDTISSADCTGEFWDDAYPGCGGTVWYYNASGTESKLFHFWQDTTVSNNWQFTATDALTCDTVGVDCSDPAYTNLGGVSHEYDAGTYEIRWTV